MKHKITCVKRWWLLCCGKGAAPPSFHRSLNLFVLTPVLFYSSNNNYSKLQDNTILSRAIFAPSLHPYLYKMTTRMTRICWCRSCCKCTQRMEFWWNKASINEINGEGAFEQFGMFNPSNPAHITLLWMQSEVSSIFVKILVEYKTAMEKNIQKAWEGVLDWLTGLNRADVSVQLKSTNMLPNS